MIRAPGPREDRAMPKYLSQEWLDEGTKLAEGQPERPGASARMHDVVTGRPGGDGKYYRGPRNRKLLRNKNRDGPAAHFTPTPHHDDSVEGHNGEVHPTSP